MALVEIKHLKKYYNTPRGLLHAIDDVTMDIEKGKTIGIVGESGCGKSTLGKTLIRMEDATDGEVDFDDKNNTFTVLWICLILFRKVKPSVPGKSISIMIKSTGRVRR